MRKLIIFSLMLASAFRADATTYYVNGGSASPGNAQIKAQIVSGKLQIVQPVLNTPFVAAGIGAGSDSNPGTFAAPFATATKANSVMAAGDTTIIYPAYYLENITNKATGTAANKVIWMTSGSGQVRLGSFMVTNDFLVIDGKNTLELTGTNNFGSTAGSIWLKPGAHNVWVSNTTVGCAFTLISQGAVNASGPSPIVLQGALGGDGYMDNHGITNVVLANLSVTNASQVILGMAGCDGVMVTNCLFTGTNGWDCIRYLGDNVRITTCAFSNYSNPHGANQVHTDIGNTFPNNGEHGTNIIFERSIIYNCIGQIQFNQGANRGGTNESFKYWTFRNNKVYNMNGQIQTCIPFSYYYNNTIYLVATNSAATPIDFNFLLDASHGDPYNGRVFNNALIACGNDPGFPPAFFDANGWYSTYTNQNGSNFSSGGTYSFRADYNYACGWPTQTVSGTWIYPPKRTGVNPFWGGVYNGITSEVHGVNGGDPMLDSTNYTGLNPTNGSPFFNHGTNLAVLYGNELPTDFYGNLRPTTGGPTNWAIGAVQITNAMSIP